MQVMTCDYALCQSSDVECRVFGAYRRGNAFTAEVILTTNFKNGYLQPAAVCKTFSLFFFYLFYVIEFNVHSTEQTVKDIRFRAAPGLRKVHPGAD